MELQLSRGQIALIDIEDYELVSEFNWRAQQNQDGRWYAFAWNPYPILVSMHRLIIGPNADEDVDHKNGNGLDNRKSNLRRCNRSQNVAAARKTSNPTTSSYKGVHWEQSRGKWKAVITQDGKSHFLGRFDGEKEAAIVYDSAALELYGEFAYQNFGQEDNSWLDEVGDEVASV